MPRNAQLRDELMAMVERELEAAEALYAVADADAHIGGELDRRLSGPTTPLILALADWDGAPVEGATLLETNANNVERFSRVVAEHGWPGLRLVGAEGADAAWMLAQHADRSNETRRTWLPALADAVASGDADPRHLATLADRVAAVAGEAQPYGTIAMLAADGEVEYPLPPADPGSLEARRAAVGLPPTLADAPYLSEGDLIPYGPDRGSAPVLQWPMLLEGHVSVEA
ncbi:MAG: hypothetical protein M3Y40_08300, partial [Chloroflexota bacterium]|nr:hypothetical protein [Chloroflexota bacterium]